MGTHFSPSSGRMKFLVSLAFLGASLAAPLPQLLTYNNLHGLHSSPVTYAHQTLAGVPTIATYAHPQNTVATYAHPQQPVVSYAPHAIPAPAVTVAHAPVVQHVGYKVTHNVKHIPQVSVQRHTPSHTTHHVINHPALPASSLHHLAAPAPVAQVAPVAEEAAADGVVIAV